MTPSNAIISLRHLSGADSGAHTQKNTRNIFLIFEFQSLTFTENHKKHWRENNYDELTNGSLQNK